MIDYSLGGRNPMLLTCPYQPGRMYTVDHQPNVGSAQKISNSTFYFLVWRPRNKHVPWSQATQM